MTEVMQGILAEAKKNKFSQIKDTLSEDDVAVVWENVSSFIEKQMSQQKGVVVNGLGTFTFTQKKLDIGNNKFILMQRPIFTLSEKFAQTHNLQHPKYHVPGQIPVVQLNFAAMSFESPFDRDTVESCVKEILGAVSRAVGAKKNVELTFTGIGRLSIREAKVKMRFFKEFISQMDGTGKLMATMQNRPGTVDSVMSDRPVSRSGSSATVILPKISGTNFVPGGNGGLAAVTEEEPENVIPTEPTYETEPELPPPAVHPIDANPLELSPGEPQVNSPLNLHTYGDKEDGMEGDEGQEIKDVATDAAIRNIENTGEGMEGFPGGTVSPPHNAELDFKDAEPGRLFPDIDEYQRKSSLPASRSGSRMAMPLAKATGVSILDDLVPSAQTPKSAPSPIHKSINSPIREFGEGFVVDGRSVRANLGMPIKSTYGADFTQESTVFKPKPPSPKLSPLQRPHSVDHVKPASPAGSACGHPNAGQELCYLCHQRARRNIPVYFTEERKRREEEEDRLLQQFQYMKDAEDTLAETENNLAKRHDLQKMSAFNLGVAEAVLTKKKTRDTDFHKSYIFQKRPLTPNRIYKQEEYSKDLAVQVDSKDAVKKKRQSDEEFLERLEQVQLAEDLAAQRDAFMKDKVEQQEMYKKALEAQITIRDRFRRPDGMLRTPEKPARLLSHQQMVSDTRFSPEVCTGKSPSISFLPMIPKTLKPFSDDSPRRHNEPLHSLKFKPLQVPPREADNEVFGKNDMNNEKMAERRRRAYDLFKDQQDLVAQRKREAILKRLNDQREEEETLDRTKRELLEDRGSRFKQRFEVRKRLENDWSKAAQLKKTNEMEERLHALSPSMLLHEQCDKYNRCAQCKRKTANCGESNIWSESRYIPGSRLMV